MNGKERARIIRFSITGITVAAIYVVGYIALERSGLHAFWANLLAFLIAVMVQYVVQTTWTFERSLRHGGQVFRFAVTIGTGLLISTILTSMVAPLLDWSVWQSALVVAVTLPIVNYLLFRFWVFAAPSAGEEV